jgi:hypothetical protein
MQAYLNQVVGGRYIKEKTLYTGNTKGTRKAYMSSLGHIRIELETTDVVRRSNVGAVRG